MNSLGSPPSHILHYSFLIGIHHLHVSQVAARFGFRCFRTVTKLWLLALMLPIFYFFPWAFDSLLMLTVKTGLSHTLVGFFLEDFGITTRSVTVWNTAYHVPVYKWLPRKLCPDPAYANTRGHQYLSNPQTTVNISCIKLFVWTCVCKLLNTADTCAKMIVIQPNT